MTICPRRFPPSNTLNSVTVTTLPSSWCRLVFSSPLKSEYTISSAIYQFIFTIHSEHFGHKFAFSCKIISYQLTIHTAFLIIYGSHAEHYAVFLEYSKHKLYPNNRLSVVLVMEPKCSQRCSKTKFRPNHLLLARQISYKEYSING